MGKFSDRLQHAWNAFMNKDPTYQTDVGPGYSYRPDRIKFTRGTERSTVISVYNRIALDAASVDIKHVRVDDNGRYIELIDDGLNQCLSVSPNIDQTPIQFLQDAILSMFDEGVVAIVPTITDINPETASFDVLSMRTGKIVEWHPKHVKIRLYNEDTGNHEELMFPKKHVAIVENPYFAIMNEYSSTVKRLIRKLMLLDNIDEQTAANRLDLIIQLPYVIKSPARKQQAEARIKDIETQLTGRKLGIAYTDGTEKVVQLNRSLDNNLLNQVEYLTNLMYSQLGITEEIMNGTADDAVMNNYFSRTIEPLLVAITTEMKRKFLTKTARTQKQSIEFYRDPLKLIPVSQLADTADKLTRNAIVTSNEMRQVIGIRPSEDPFADELRNKNISPAKDEDRVDVNGEIIKESTDEIEKTSKKKDAKKQVDDKNRRKNQNEE